MEETKKRSFRKKLKIYICIIASLLVVLLTTSFIVISLNIKDKTKSTYEVRNIEYSEIVKKNYIDGFKDTSTSNMFTYSLPKEDINELLNIGVNLTNDKYISSIYYDFNEDGHYFYVDLNKVVVKTRVIFSFIPTLLDNTTIKLNITSISMGKVNAKNILEKKGYLTNKFIDDYFAKCHLPIRYDKNNLSFLVKPLAFINDFPTSNIGEYIFNASKNILGAYSLHTNNIFGFDLDISKLKGNDEYIDVASSDAPNIKEDLIEACNTNYSSMSEGESKTIYTLTELDLNKLIKETYKSNQKEEINSNFTSNKVIFDLIGVNAHIDTYNNIRLCFFYSINGYIIETSASIEAMNNGSQITYAMYFDVKESDVSITNISMKDTLSNLSSGHDYFRYISDSMFMLDLGSINEELVEPLLKYAPKSININHSSHLIEFILTKE